MEKGKKTWRIWRTLWKERLCVRESVREREQSVWERRLVRLVGEHHQVSISCERGNFGPSFELGCPLRNLLETSLLNFAASSFKCTSFSGWSIEYIVLRRERRKRKKSKWDLWRGKQFVCCICCCCCLTSLTKPRRGTRKRRRKERRTGEERQHSFRGLKMRSTTSFCFLTQPLNWYTGKLKKAGVFEHFRVEERVKGKRKKNKSWESKVALHSIETIEVNLFTCRVTFSHLESLKPSLGV